MDGHRAFFYPTAKAQNLEWQDSGYRAFAEMPENTKQAQNLKIEVEEVVAALQGNLTAKQKETLVWNLAAYCNDLGL